MSTPISLDVPHKLGRDEARKRIEGGMGKLPGFLPPGADVKSAWAGDRLDLTVTTLGQTVLAKLDVRETLVHVEAVLPGLLGLFAGAITDAMRDKGGKLLEDKRDKDS